MFGMGLEFSQKKVNELSVLNVSLVVLSLLMNVLIVRLLRDVHGVAPIITKNLEVLTIGQHLFVLCIKQEYWQMFIIGIKFSAKNKCLIDLKIGYQKIGP